MQHARCSSLPDGPRLSTLAGLRERACGPNELRPRRMQAAGVRTVRPKRYPTARPERRRHDVQCAVQCSACGMLHTVSYTAGRHSRMGYSSVTASLRIRLWIMRFRVWIFRIWVWIIRLRVWIIRNRVHGRYSRTGHALGDGIMYIDILHSSGRMVQIAGEVRPAADHSAAQQTDTRATHKRCAESRATHLYKAVTHGSPELPRAHRIACCVQRIRPS